MKCYLVLDVGTTGVKALVFSRDLKVQGRAYERMRKAHPRKGWVEQSPREMVQLSKKVLRAAVRASKVSPRQISALGITNQRETAIVWNSRTGKPIYPAIVWEDKRTAKECARILRNGPSPPPGLEAHRAGGQPSPLTPTLSRGERGIETGRGGLMLAKVREKTGLTIDPYFSATKLGWILKNVVKNRSHPSLPPPLNLPLGQGEKSAGRGGKRSISPPLGGGVRGGVLHFGTVDTWTLWNLLEGRPHLTDWTNASRTLLYNIRTLKWDEDLLRIFGVPREVLPEVRPSQSHFGFLRKEILGVRLPVRAVCGDQQASMYGVGARSGATKATYGTGTFLMQALGLRFVLKQPFFTTLMPGIKRPQFALEAKIEGSGAKIDKVLHDGKKLDRALTAIAKDVDVYLKKLPIRPQRLAVDGGITRDGKIVAIQSRVSGVPVRRQTTEDGTALGVAKLLKDYTPQGQSFVD